MAAYGFKGTIAPMSIFKKNKSKDTLEKLKPTTTLKPAREVNTAAVVVTGLIGGWLTARETGIRPLGGVILAAAGGYAARSWNAKAGAGTAAGLTALYTLAFGASHPLAKKMGSWPAVITVTAAADGAAYALSDAK